MTKEELGKKTKAKFPQYNNLSDVEVADKLIAKYPVYAKQIDAAPVKQTAGFGKYDLKEAGQDIAQTFGALKNTAKETFGKVSDISKAQQSGKQGLVESFGQSVGAVASGISKGFGDIFTGSVKTVLPQQAESTIKMGIEKVVPVLAEVDKAIGSPVGTTIKNYEALSPRAKRNVDAFLGIASLATDVLGAGVGKKTAEEAAKLGAKTAVKTAEEVAKLGAKTATKIGESVPAITGGVGKASEFIERIPRAVERLREGSQEATERAIKIKQSSPEVADAIKSNLDEKFINTISEADEATKKAYKQVIDIAEETPKNIGLKKQPSIISGELAAKQADLIIKQKQKIGKEIGEKVKQLSKTETIDMGQGFKEIDDILGSQGIGLNYTKKGVKLDFSGSKYTPAERTKIQELYNLATEGGSSLSPNSIHGKDQLFSKLQRESAMEGVGKIMIDTPDGAKSLFSVFRDVFSKNLDNVSPEIRDLNKKYRDLILITDDIEDSILKTPNFNITKTGDPAEFAKVNLRRIFGESQSSPVFEAIADQMDTLARQLGYTEATPKNVAEFAQELRKLYPESIPKTGFQGGISTGINGAIGQLAEAALKAGAPNVKDQRKALINLINSSLKN